MDLHLAGKRAVVLAASGGLGKAVALQLSREGTAVALCSRDLARAEAAAAEIVQATGGVVHPFAADVADEASLSAFIESAAAALGGVDLLVCNAGGPPPGGFKDLGEQAWRTGYELTLMSVVRSVNLVLPHMKGAGGGSILVLGSSSVKQPLPNLLISNVFRPGLQALVKHLSGELASDNIRVNMLSPGRILTDRTKQLDAARAQREGKSEQEVRAASVSQIPMGRLGEPEEFGRVAAFILSPAASYMTGTSTLVDGGMVKAL